MARLRFTAAAKDDLEDIAVYIAERSGVAWSPRDSFDVSARSVVSLPQLQS